MKFKGKAISTSPVEKNMSVVDLVDNCFCAFNAARISEICQLLVQKIMKDDVIVGLSLTGALTPAGLGSTSLLPLMKNGFIDYIISTGANLYHDIHFGLGHTLHKSSPFVDDLALQKEDLIRIYDIVMDNDVLVNTNRFIYKTVQKPEFQKKMPSSELHYLLGKYLSETEKETGREGITILAEAYRNGIPVYTPSPYDSAIGLDIAEKSLNGVKTEIDVLRDVNEVTAIAYMAKQTAKSAVIILGGGSPKNFILQTIPQLNDLMDHHIKGHNYFIQITDARPDTGGLSGATPSEAVSWGKLDPDMLPHAVVGYVDITIALPLITSYVITKCAPRKQKRLYDQRDRLLGNLIDKVKKNVREDSKQN